MCSDSLRELLLPFVTSCYTCSLETPSHRAPIFRPDLSYGDWLCSWCFHLIGKVRDERTRNVLIGCRDGKRERERDATE